MTTDMRKRLMLGIVGITGFVLSLGGILAIQHISTIKTLPWKLTELVNPLIVLGCFFLLGVFAAVFGKKLPEDQKQNSEENLGHSL